MRLEVIHRTTYTYAETAAFSQHLLRLMPRESADQKVLSTRISIHPTPDGGTDQTDLFGNATRIATVSRGHDRLEIVATSIVRRLAPAALIFEASAPWEEVRDIALGNPGHSPVADVSPHAFPSQMTEPDRAIEDWAAESLTPGRPVLAAAAEISHRIHEEFKYSPGATDAGTMPVQSFAARAGVCQDFAHVMLAALRSRRVPARYVSGYLRTIPPEGQERLTGADASHAWVSVWDPAFGWVDFDPTNDLQPGTDHVTLAWGRDYMDVSPVSGVVIGAGRQQLSVGVDVTPVGGAA